MKRADAKLLIPFLAVVMAACTSVPVEPESMAEPETKASTSPSTTAATAAGATPDAVSDASAQKPLSAMPDASARRELERDAAAESAINAPNRSVAQSASGTPVGNGSDHAGSSPGNAAGAASRPSRTAKSVEALERQLDAELSAFDAVVAETTEEPSAWDDPASSPTPAGGSAGDADAAANRNRGSGQRPDALYVGEKPPPPGLRRPSWAEDADRASTSAAPAAGQGTQPDAAKDFYADDDVVARQLREAAERETDPELAEKLWQEYRNYKEVVQ